MSDAVGAIVGGLTGALGAGVNYLNTENTNKANALENEKSRQWQSWQIAETRKREDNAIQRQSEDMKKAGINRLMAGNAGGGAPASMSGGAPSVIPNQKADTGNIIANTGLNIVSDLKKEKEINKLESETNENIRFTEYMKKTEAEQIELLSSQIENTTALTGQIRVGVLEAFQKMAESKDNMLTNEAQRTLMMADTEQKRIEAAKIGMTISLIEEQVKLTRAQTEGTRQAGLKAYNDATKSAEEAEKIRKEIELIVKNTEIQDINLRWLSSEKAFEQFNRVGQGGALGNIVRAITAVK